MDPSLQDTTCVCPEKECRDGMVFGGEAPGVWLEECSRCDGIGYILCDDLRPGERTYTMSQQRAKVIVECGYDRTRT